MGCTAFTQTVVVPDMCLCQQGFAEANVIQLSVNLDWTPNRAVILAVHRYWVGKLYRHKRWLDFGKATNGSNQSGSMSRSFSASPPMPSTRSDISALTLEDYALSQVISHPKLLLSVILLEISPSSPPFAKLEPQMI